MDRLDELHARVLADPDDDGLRTVWADALLDRADPLGELIALQIATRGVQPTAAQATRMRSLIAKHRLGLLGPLADIVQHREGLVFDRGLLDACQIQVKRLPALSRAIGDPRWSALRSIWFCDKFARDPRIVPLLLDPVFRRLREITCIGANQVLYPLATQPRPLPVTAIWAVDDSWRTTTSGLRDLDDAPGLPALRRLGFVLRDEDASWIAALPIVHRLDELAITSDAPAIDWIARTTALDKLTTLELRTHWIPEQGPTRPHYIVRFTRGTKRQWSRLSITPFRRPRTGQVSTMLDSIPADLPEHIEAPGDLAPLLRRFHRAVVVPTAD